MFLLADSDVKAEILPPLPADGHWFREAEFIKWCQLLGPGMAVLLLLLGVIFLLWGYPVFRYLIMLNFGVAAAYLGAALGKNADTILAGAIVGGFLGAALAWPMMRWAVALTGAGIGTILGAAVWRACGQDPMFDWAGGLTGFFAFGMLSFIAFRGGIILYTSLQGGGLLAAGLLSLAEKYSIGATLGQHLTTQKFLLPAAVMIPAVVGLVYQHHNSGGGAAGAAKKPGGK
ncbi:MAG TPA: hypothetical protein VL992_14625 [Tepidisphaeraceae bacterium]|nr:hypothetical protein [Tepidisphaeraceae bacterium]